MQGVVRRLKDRGLVDSRPDPGDARRTLLSLTLEGQRVGQQADDQRARGVARDAEAAQRRTSSASSSSFCPRSFEASLTDQRRARISYTLRHRTYTNDMADYLRPASLEEALAALARPWTVLAGGTDFYPARVGRAIDEDVLDITGNRGFARHFEPVRRAGGWAPPRPGRELIEAAAAAAVRRPEAGGPRGRRPRRSRTPARSPAICATPRPPPTACRRCWRSMPRSSWPAAPARGGCRSRPSSPAIAAPRWRPASCWSRSTCRSPRTTPAAPSSSSARGAIW